MSQYTYQHKQQHYAPKVISNMTQAKQQYNYMHDQLDAQYAPGCACVSLVVRVSHWCCVYLIGFACVASVVRIPSGVRVCHGVCHLGCACVTLVLHALHWFRVCHMVLHVSYLFSGCNLGFACV